MTAAIEFPSTTPHFALPLLFSGQAQKEFYINQAISVIDSMLQGGVSDSLSTPPANPSEGEAFRVLPSSTGVWAQREDQLAIWIGGSWHYVQPALGMMIFDRAASTMLYFKAGWQNASEPAVPVGGTTVDNEARAAVSDLISALKTMGIF